MSDTITESENGNSNNNGRDKKSSEVLDDVTLLSVTRSAVLLKIGRDSLVDLINAGKIKTLFINKRHKIPYGELKRFIEDNMYCNTTITEIPEWSPDITISNKEKHLGFNSTELFNKIKGDILYG